MRYLLLLLLASCAKNWRLSSQELSNYHTYQEKCAPYPMIKSRDLNAILKNTSTGLAFCLDDDYAKILFVRGPAGWLVIPMDAK